MKKILFLFAICFMAVGCEKVILSESYPQIEAFYKESLGLSAITSLDSVRAFSQKVNSFTSEYPDSKESPLYPQIQENIRVASLRIKIECDSTWAGTINLNFGFNDYDAE